MYNPLAIIILVACLITSILASCWFNCSIHSEIRRRLGIQSNSRVIPVTYAVEVNNIPENSDIYVVNSEQIITV